MKSLISPPGELSSATATITTVVFGCESVGKTQLLASLVGLGTTGGFSLGSIAVATGGALLLLFLYRKMKAA